MRVALYARVSTRDKGQNTDTQMLQLRDEATRFHKEPWEVVGEFVDKISALKMSKRVAWQEVMGLVETGQVDCVVVTKLDRAFRSLQDMFNTMNIFEQHNVNLVCTTQPVDTTTASGRFMFKLLALFAEFERALIVERIHEGLERAKHEGKPLGRPKGKKDRDPRSNEGYLLRHAMERRKKMIKR